ncbi:MAG: single-stranded DNA-binding protein [Clostridia bacterium]|nr:single-stranded DNA-binding protein [Clostridia bacterium]
MINNVVLMGRLAVDPELRTTPTGVSVTSFAIAVERSYAKQGEDRTADFIDIVAWRQSAEFITRYFRKGSMIAIEGSLQTRTYTDKDGNKRKAVEVLANRVSFCGSKNETGTAGASRFDTPGSASGAAYTSGGAGDFESIVDDEDLPFF